MARSLKRGMATLFFNAHLLCACGCKSGASLVQPAPRATQQRVGARATNSGLCSRSEVRRHGGGPLTGEQVQQRRARVSSGKVSRRLRLPALSTVHPGCVSTRGLGSPERVTGETMVASRAKKPLATTSMRRPSVTGTWTFISATRTTRAPASQHTLATAHSSGSTRDHTCRAHSRGSARAPVISK